ncbi:LAME_0B04126g1_1 [Lachancea meyersii CBS 8951]|uniref:LAME_0B04126g1_1 n=1 Tax=Lachancea meyersii CBS 8951 TaxID=1266667 RepID=A0A1G4IV57_9SACH|nr:LAME_0B04126g1_1 [Lachancea meyersii CBS 8951]
MDFSPLDRFPGEQTAISPSWESILAEESPLSTADTVGTVTTIQTASSSCQDMVNAGSNGTPTWSDTASLNNLLSENALESIRRQRAQNKLIHLDPIPDFKDRKEIKTWLQKIFYPQGIEIVIERSDKIKVVFKCKASKRGRTFRTPAATDGSTPDENPESPQAAKRILQNSKKTKRCVSPYNTCPFRVRATYSLKRKKWNIVVMNNGHSHPLKFNADSEEYKKFKEVLREQEDWDAVRKFDELECRTRFNLPIEPQAIPCDCGLTQEIKSFDIVLPTSDSMTKTVDKTVSKPAHKSRGSRKNQKLAHLLSRNTTPHGWDSGAAVTEDGGNDQSNEPGVSIPVENDVASSQPVSSSAPSWDPVNFMGASEEVDFTDLFLKPLPRVKQESALGKQTLQGTGGLLPELNQWAVDSKTFMEELHLTPSEPICELNHTNHCDCIPLSSTSTPFNASQAGNDTATYEEQIQSPNQLSNLQRHNHSAVGGYLSTGMQNLHLTNPHMHTTGPYQDPIWDVTNGTHSHEQV